MMKNKNNNILENEEYIEEVPIEDLKEDRVIKHNKYILILIILIFLSLFFFLFGIYFKINNSKGTSTSNDNFVPTNLFIIHSKNEFGDNINLSNFNSENNSYNYSFRVKNGYTDKISYNIILEDIDFNSKSICNKTNINYSVSLNGEIVNNGVMTNTKEVTLYSTNINASSSNDYILNIWSNNKCKNKLNFKIFLSD